MSLDGFSSGSIIPVLGGVQRFRGSEVQRFSGSAVQRSEAEFL